MNLKQEWKHEQNRLCRMQPAGYIFEAVQL